MPRSTDLSSHNLIRKQFLNHTTSHVNGPLPFLNPTSAHVHLDSPSPSPNPSNPPASPSIKYKWSSRNNRKGRHTLAISPSLAASPTPTPKPTTTLTHILKTTLSMLTRYPYWDVSWWVAYTFTWGSIVWVLNAFFVFLPYIRPQDTFATEIAYGGGITAFIGATIFVVGSVLLMIEAVNENRAECFGWEVRRAFDAGEAELGMGMGTEKGLVVQEKECVHHHANRRNFVGTGPKGDSSAGVKSSGSSDEEGAMTKEERAMREKRRAWIWWPSMKELKEHYLRELGFLASMTQMAAATIFWIAGFTALPGIQNNMSQGLLDGVYWTPQVIGGLGFIISGTLFMLETQKKWYLPAFNVLGWHIGLWNTIGGFGFFLSPIFGYYTVHWAQYQAGCQTFYGSWAFLIGSVIQLYESLDKRVVVVEGAGNHDG